MKYFIFCFLVVVLPIKVNAQVTRVAILDFENISGIAKYDGLGKAMSSMLISDIELNVSSKRLQLVERAQIQKVLKEQSFQVSGSVDKSTAVQAGKILGVSYLLVGDVYILDDQLIINARLTNAETGDIIFSKKQEGKTVAWLTLKTVIAKELATSLSQPFIEPTIPDKEIQVATITTFGNAVIAKDEGIIEKAEELLKMVQEISPDFKYLDDMKSQLDDLKKQVEKNTVSIQILEKSGGRIINASSYEELEINLQNGLTSTSEQINYLIELFNNYPLEIEQNINSYYEYPMRNHLGYTEEIFLEDLLLIKQLYARSINKKISTKYAVGRLKTLVLNFNNLTYYQETKNMPLEKKMPKIVEYTTLIRELITSLEIDDLEKSRLGLSIYKELLEAVVPFYLFQREHLRFYREVTPIEEKKFFFNLSNINTFIYIDKEIKYYSSKILTDSDNFMVSILHLIDDIYYYKKFLSFILYYTNNENKLEYTFQYTDELKGIFEYNKIKPNNNFHIIELGFRSEEKIQILNEIFFIDNFNNIKVNMKTFQDKYTFPIEESKFFTQFISIVKEITRVEGEVFDSITFNRILLFRNSPSDKYEIICLF